MTFDQYVGIPYVELGRTKDGWDCWGLICVVLAEQFGVFAEPDVGLRCPRLDGPELDIELEMWNEVERPEVGSVALFAIGDLLHCGLIIEPGRMLHCMQKVETCVERIDSAQWRKRRRGFYLHRCMPTPVSI